MGLSILLYAVVIAGLIILIVLFIDYHLVKNSYKELGTSINKIFDRASKIAIIAFIISWFKSNSDNENL